MELQKLRDNYLQSVYVENAKKIEAMEVVDRLEDLSYQNDSIMITELFIDWLKKAKNDNQKKIINTCFLAQMRIDTYVKSVQNRVKSLSLKFVELRNENTRLMRENSEQKKTIDSLIKQIEFLENEQN